MNELDIKRRANEFLHKGRYQEAIAEYQSLLSQLRKPNPAILNLIGDLHVKQGDFEKGFECYLQASRGYAEEGLFHNGIAVGKKVLRLDKDQNEVYGMLGLLYARQGLGMDCVKFLGEYARRMERAGEFPAALASYAEACEVLSDFPDVHMTYGEMLEGVDRKEDAATAFERAATAFAEREMHAEAMEQRRRARALRGGGGPSEESKVRGVRELMNLRTLDDTPKPATSPSRGKAWNVFDPAQNPEIPPPPPLPRRPGAKRVAPVFEPVADLAEEPIESSPQIYELPIELPRVAPAAPPPPPAPAPVELPQVALPPRTVAPPPAFPPQPVLPPPLPVAAEAAGEEADPYALELEPPHAAITKHLDLTRAPEAMRPDPVVPAEPAEAPELVEFFETAAGAESERAVIVGDDFELVREGGDVYEVINDFREATMELLDLDDHQSHYDLGTTYMEMELFDEAAAEFEISARGPTFALPSQEMLGYCFLRKGQIDLAIRELRKGLAIEGHDDRDKLGLLYNLGVACRVVDRESDAIGYFRRILEIDPDFRDTRSRLERLVNAG
ncbi:MAG: tetratricopeptide repeat protein [Candidatus Eiseniibacteriota bacterium]